MGRVSPEDYLFVSRILREQTGIELGEGKEYLVESRLGEVCRSVGVVGIANLMRSLRDGGRGPLVPRILEALTTNETYFFRDETAYASLRQTVIPSLVKQCVTKRSLRIWSAACSTGQEPYSIALMLDEFPELKSWRVEIFASDIAEGKVLERARSGLYLDHEVKRGLTPKQLVDNFERSGKDWVISQRLRRLVSFNKVNLLDVPASLGRFDLVLCRNVLIYFDLATKRRVLQSLAHHLDPDGFLILGGSEVLFGISNDFRRETDAAKGCFFRKTSYKA